jgi:branched-chain amino acid transport system permease protein
MSLIFVILASSLDIIVGTTGLLSLGHHAFFGIGAYTSALLFLHFRLPMWGGMFAGAIMASVAAFLLGALVLKVRGNRFIITTIAFAEILRLVAYNWTKLTRGQMGLPGVLPPKIVVPGLGIIDLISKQSFYYVILMITLLSVLILNRIARSPIGMGLAAVRENEGLAESVGISVYRYSIIAFVTGAFFAGIAGSLYAHYINFVSPDLFYFSYMTIMLVMVVMGGMGTIIGPVFGAVLFTLLPECLRIAAAFRLVFFGSILIIAILFIPGGLVEIWGHVQKRLGRHEGKPC